MTNEKYILSSDTACRITSARIGFDERGTFGIYFGLSGQGWSSGYSKRFIASDGWDEANTEVVVESLRWLDQLLRDANVDSLDKLVGKPAVGSNVEAGQICNGFRIMTEVL